MKSVGMDDESLNSTTEIDQDRQKRAKEYSRINRRLMVVDIAISGVYILAWLIFGWSHILKNWLLHITTNEWFLIASYVVIFGSILFIINIPLSYYQGYILPHQFELSTQTLTGWISDQIKGILVGGVLGTSHPGNYIHGITSFSDPLVVVGSWYIAGVQCLFLRILPPSC